MHQFFSAKERPVRLKPETGKADGHLSEFLPNERDAHLGR